VNLARAALSRPAVVLTLSLLVLIVGVQALLTMPRRATPKISIKEGLVVSVYPGATAEEVEDRVTRRVESYLFTFAEVDQKTTTSLSRNGLSIIRVTLSDSVEDTDTVWQKLQLGLVELRLLEMPSGVLGPVVDSDFGDVVAVLLAVHSPQRSYEEIEDAVERVEDALRTLEPTSKVRRIGYRPEAIYVTADSRRLAGYGVGLEAAIAALRAQNSVDYTGSIETGGAKVPLRTTGSYSAVEQVRRQRLLTLPNGDDLRLGDVATVERRRADPTSAIRVDGSDDPVMLLAVEMAPGFNIVSFGDQIDRQLEAVRQRLPADIQFTTINNQPEVVAESVNDFVREFFIAVAAVILVIILLLPLRVASIAAMAIPVTVAFTFAALRFLGIELHEVSLASLIVVLGMVVDDAIVIADNYVEKLDEGIPRWEAAWRSASELFVPVLTATVAIIVAFAPMAFVLDGAVGEFIVALPITVAVALLSSFLVAMTLTPILCYTMIREGLGGGDGEGKRSSSRILDGVQAVYGKTLHVALARPWITAVVAVASVLVGAALLLVVDERFFPVAERAQLVIELDMPLGTALEVTDGAVRRVESVLADDPRIAGYAAFVGTPAPRVYYSFAPEFPRQSYGMLLVNTHTIEDAEAVVAGLEGSLAAVAPAAEINSQLFMQGIPVGAPVEIRIVGDDIPVLEELGEKVAARLRQVAGARLVGVDFKDQFQVSLDVDEEVANSLGFSTSDIARNVAIGFGGLPVSTLWEGHRRLDIVFRLADEARGDFDALTDMSVRSPISQGSLPVREFGRLVPEWHSGQIARRNGVRTLTVSAHPRHGALPADLLSEIRPWLDLLGLPPGYRIEIGGEREGELDTFRQMGVSLIVSLLLIFVILLLQFGNTTQSLMVMVAIPLSLLGAVLGLLMTGNPLGFTASVGLLSLVGIVIRNSIILIDYANERMREDGMAACAAAMAAGERRLRPIFLTSMAAAVGVVPMIVSGSALWAPLASVFAVGVLFSMVMTLVVIPVLYCAVVARRPTLVLRPEGVA